MNIATSLLKRGDNAIVIFTYGKYFNRKHDGSGSTGNWVIDQSRACRKVVIYNRTDAGNEIYIARRTRIRPSKEQGRYVIHLADVRYFGCTYLNWVQFTGSRNPIRYWKDTLARRRGARKSAAESAVMHPLAI